MRPALSDPSRTSVHSRGFRETGRGRRASGLGLARGDRSLPAGVKWRRIGKEGTRMKDVGRAAVVAALGIGAALAAPACKNGNGGGGGDSTSLVQACADLATSQCSQE